MRRFFFLSAVIILTDACHGVDSPVSPDHVAILDGIEATCDTCSVRDSDSDGLDDRQEKNYIQAYRPRFGFHEDGLYPMTITEFMSRGGFVRNTCRSTSYAFSNIVSFNAQLTNPLFNQNSCSRIDSNNIVGASPYEDAPFYADAVPYTSASGQQLVWVQYWLFWGFDQVPSQCPGGSHDGDWEWVDWLVLRNPYPSSGDAWFTNIKAMHFHAHNNIDVTTSTSTSSIDTYGGHVIAYVEQLSHGMHRKPYGESACNGPARAWPGYLLSSAYLSDNIYAGGPYDQDAISGFTGLWGFESGTGAGIPKGPFYQRNLEGWPTCFVNGSGGCY